MMKLNSKKAIMPLFLILIILLILIGIYCLLFLPIPAFTKIRMFINYFLILIFWIVLQVGLIYAYYRAGSFAGKEIKQIRGKIIKWSIGIKHYIISHRG
jgi:hypothetical protein